MERFTDKLYNSASVLGPKTRAQACETAQMPFIAPHLALMPDAHLGLGATRRVGDPYCRSDHAGEEVVHPRGSEQPDGRCRLGRIGRLPGPHS